MVKKATFLSAILILLAALVLLLLTSLPVRETSGLPEPEPVPTGIAGILFQLQNAEDGDGDTAAQVLRELAMRDDAIGYAAGLALADKVYLTPTNPETTAADEKKFFLLRALELYDNKQARLKLAALLESQGDTAAAVGEYLALLPDNETLLALIRIDADMKTILGSLIAGKHWQTAALFIAGLPEDPEPYDAQLQFMYSKVLVETRQAEKALPKLTILAETPSPEILLYYARALEAAGENDKAIFAYKQAGSPGANNLGKLYELLGKTESAAAAYLLSSEAAALWRGAILTDQAGQTKNALQTYLALSLQPGSYQDDAAYRAYMLQKGSSDAEKLLPYLTAPAWQARLGRPPLPASVPDPPEVAAPVFELLAAYQAAGRNDLSEIELGMAWRKSQPEIKLAIGQWYLSKGDLQQAVRWGAATLRDLPARRAYLLAYPKPFTDDVLQAAAEFHLEPELIWAVMREESRYQASVVSRVGAIGLMQIMPATGKEIASSLRTVYQEQDLYEPRTNIRFGTYYLHKLLARYNGNLDKALAAYNGGPGNVKRWSESPIGKTESGFPTAITFFETREYITKVSNSYYIYKWLSEN